MTLKASLEYPKGRKVSLRWGGSTSVVIAPGDNAPLTDPVPTPIPDGAEFWVRTFMEMPDGCTICDIKDSIGGDMAEYGSGTLTDKTVTGTIIDDTPQFYCYGPLAIVGQTRKPSALILGDSRNHAAPSAVHLDTQSNRGNIAHAIGGQFGYINCAKSGSRMSQLVASHTRIAALKTYVTDVIIQHGINDITNGASGATAVGLLNSILGYFTDKKRWVAKIEPVSTSTDGWFSSGNQTIHASNPQRVIYNDNIRSGLANVAGYFEFADDVESSRNSGVFKVADTATPITSDGTHLNDNGHVLVDQMGTIDPRRIFRYPEPVARWATRDEWELGDAANKWLSPTAINRSRLMATKTANQTGIVAGVTTLVSWQTVDMRGGRWDVTNYCWYPPKGFYRITCQVAVSAGTEDD